MSDQGGVHQIASDGFAKGSLYDQHRPAYPPEAVELLLNQLGLTTMTGAKIVDLGAGTGKFTEALATRQEHSEIVAVEPLDSMRDVLASKRLDRVEARRGTATQTGLEDGWADVVIVAQAFHWFANMDALNDIHRILKPGGRLGLIWNIDEYNRPKSWPATTKWENGMAELVAGLAAGEPAARFRDDKWPAIFETQAESASPLFAMPLGTRKVSWSVRSTRDGLLDRISTLSHIALLEGTQREAFTARYDAILEQDDVARDSEGRIESHGATFFAWTTKL